MEEETSKDLILEEFLPYKLAIVSHTVSSLVARVYDKRFGLTIPEWRVIAIVGRFPGLSAVEVAERTMMDKVAVSRAVTKLIKSGRIDRQFADGKAHLHFPLGPRGAIDNGPTQLLRIAQMFFQLEHQGRHSLQRGAAQIIFGQHSGQRGQSFSKLLNNRIIC